MHYMGPRLFHTFSLDIHCRKNAAKVLKAQPFSNGPSRQRTAVTK
jgi:hypothetical protein